MKTQSKLTNPIICKTVLVGLIHDITHGRLKYEIFQLSPENVIWGDFAITVDFGTSEIHFNVDKANNTFRVEWESPNHPSEEPMVHNSDFLAVGKFVNLIWKNIL